MADGLIPRRDAGTQRKNLLFSGFLCASASLREIQRWIVTRSYLTA